MLERERARGGRYPHTLLDRLLDDERWPCKGNLRTRLNDMDELVGDIAEQSVYVTLPNPLRAQIELVAADPDAHRELVHGWMNEPHVAEWWGPPADVRAYLAEQVALAHSQPWIATADGVPFAYVETYRAAEDPLAELLRRASRRPRLARARREQPRRDAGAPASSAGSCSTACSRTGDRVVCEPDVRNTRMLAFCRALGGEVRATLELPDKRAALVVWER